jgi:hypothetical protein
MKQMRINCLLIRKTSFWLLSFWFKVEKHFLVTVPWMLVMHIHLILIQWLYTLNFEVLLGMIYVFFVVWTCRYSYFWGVNIVGCSLCVYTFVYFTLPINYCFISNIGPSESVNHIYICQILREELQLFIGWCCRMSMSFLPGDWLCYNEHQ